MNLLSLRQKAFTLLELIVVIVILGVLAAIAIPTFQSVISKSQDSTTKAKLAAVGRDALAIYTLGGTTLDQALVSAAGETSAFAPGTSAAALTAVADSGNTQPTTGQIVYKLSGSSLGYALFAKSGDTCYALLSSAGVSSAVTWCDSGSADPAAAALSGPSTASSASASPSASTPSFTVGTGLGTASSPLTLTGAVSTLAGGSAGYVDATGTAAKFSFPSAATTDGTYIYVADFNNNRIRQVSISTGVVTTLAGSGASAETDGTGTSASFKGPYGIATDGVNLYVADASGNSIRQVALSSGAVTTLAGSTTSGYVDGTGSAARFSSPYGLGLFNGVLYIADNANNRIRALTLTTNTVTTFAGSGRSGSSDGVGTAADFSGPESLTTDGTSLYATADGGTIRVINPSTRAVTTLAGSPGTGYVDGTGSTARFNFPAGITTDGTYLYVADSYNNRLRKVTISSGAVTTLAGSGAYSDSDGTGTAAGIRQPEGITTANGKLYVADAGGNTLRIVS